MERLYRFLVVVFDARATDSGVGGVTGVTGVTARLTGDVPV